MNKFIKEFSCECKKNREYLNYTIEDVCDFLVDVSEEEYQAFELGKKVLDKDNLIKLGRVLCVQKPPYFNVEDYIDTSSLSEEEIEDVSKVLEYIVGVEND